MISLNKSTFPITLANTCAQLPTGCRVPLATAKRHKSMIGRSSISAYYITCHQGPNNLSRWNLATDNLVFLSHSCKLARNWDFILQAHAAVQGTARPAHYFVVYDKIFRSRKVQAPFQNSREVLENLMDRGTSEGGGEKKNDLNSYQADWANCSTLCSSSLKEKINHPHGWVADKGMFSTLRLKTFGSLWSLGWLMAALLW